MQRLRELLAPLIARVNELRQRLAATRDRGLDVWNRLTPRDQQLITWVGSAAGTLLTVALIFAASSHLATVRKRIDTRTKQLVQVRDMRSQYNEEKGRLDSINA